MADTTQFANIHSATLAQNHSDPPFGFQSFVPSSTAFDVSEGSTFNSSIPGETSYSIQVRRPSQSEVTGSPASSYAHSLSDPRNSISYGTSMPFKVPATVNLDRRTSSPIALARNQQQDLGNMSYAQAQQTNRNDMHSSLWTPNFSFGNSTQPGETKPQIDGYTSQALQAKQQYLNARRGSQDIRLAPHEMPTQYNYDRRMSHPVLSSNSFDSTTQVPRNRQVSACDWRTFNSGQNGFRPGTTDTVGLWNTLDSARGMAALSQQTAECKSRCCLVRSNNANL